MREKLGKSMIILGIVLLLVPIIGAVYTYYEARRLYADFLKDLENTSQITAYTKDKGNAVQPPPSQQEEEAEKHDKGVLGKIKIPSIEADLLLLEGTGEKALALGAGHLENTAFPGETGNCAIAGHRNYTFGQMFNRLNEVKLKDHIIVELGKESFIYEVTDIKLVKPQDMSVLLQPQDKKLVTLITCHPVYRATHRLIITGELIE